MGRLEWRSRELVSFHATEATEPVNIVNVGYKSTNYFAIGSTGTPLLVDCGWPGTMPLLLANLKRADIALSALKYLLVTHFHPDHAGLAQELKQAGLTLLVFEGQEPFIAPLKQWMIVFPGIPSASRTSYVRSEEHTSELQSH